MSSAHVSASCDGTTGGNPATGTTTASFSATLHFDSGEL
jgi:hypothetical protein